MCDKEWNCFEHILWKRVLQFGALHVAALYGFYLCLTRAHILTILSVPLLLLISGFGIGAGVHRLWCHRSYKATLPLRVLLACLNSMAFQHTIFYWARNHRVHHKYTDTDADPYNAKRGFFFSHFGWLLVEKHPDVKRLGDKLDNSDMLADPVVRLQSQYYMRSVLLFCFALPALVPRLLWAESLLVALFVCGFLRATLGLHMSCLINSAAHKWGYKPYDVRITPTTNKFLAFLVFGEGFHNYHHAFPWDYRISEFGWSFNNITAMLDLFAKFGWVYDRRIASQELIEKRKRRTGDPSLLHSHQHTNHQLEEAGEDEAQILHEF